MNVKHTLLHKIKITYTFLLRIQIKIQINRFTSLTFYINHTIHVHLVNHQINGKKLAATDTFVHTY